jgi:hypothetical protein
MGHLGFLPPYSGGPVGGYSGGLLGGSSGSGYPGSYPSTGGYPSLLGYPGYPLPAGLLASLGFSHATLQSGSPGVINITSSITIRLTSENYLFWKAQVGLLLRSNLLMGYVDGLFVCPLMHTIVDHGGVAVPQPSPAYQHWIQQDQAILFIFVSSMTEGVVGMVMFASSSHEAWETLVGAFVATSFARSSGLRQ